MTAVSSKQLLLCRPLNYIPVPVLDGLFLHLAVTAVSSKQLPLCRPLNYIPVPVLDGLFLYLAVTAVSSNQLFKRSGGNFLNDDAQLCPGTVHHLPRHFLPLRPVRSPLFQGTSSFSQLRIASAVVNSSLCGPLV